jgi:hypothetical protein
MGGVSMNTYKVTYTCPHCPIECFYGAFREANELINAKNKTEARRIFQSYKGCRWQKISRIELIED